MEVFDWLPLARKLAPKIELKYDDTTPNFAFFKLTEKFFLSVCLHFDNGLIYITAERECGEKNPSGQLRDRVEQIRQILRKERTETAHLKTNRGGRWIFVLYCDKEQKLLKEVIKRAKKNN